MGFREEIIEIYEEMKEDYKKGKQYAYEYRKTIFWIFITFIAMQFTNVLSLGASWQNMCQQNPDLQLKKVQSGGAVVESSKIPDSGESGKSGRFKGFGQKVSGMFKIGKTGKNPDADAAKPAAETTKPAGDAKLSDAEKAAYKQGKSVVEAEKRAKAQAKAEKAARKSGARSFKAFQGLKQLGPISGFFSKIGGYLKGGFFILGMILAILFISFIPMVLFCTAMYYIFKYIGKKLTLL
jgi:hypothetical protein